jgi:Protein of unknown function (DUF3800)
LGGGILKGDHIVRIIYLDESGISASEPYAVVAGVIIHADKQWKAIERYLLDMADSLIPAAMRVNFCFHATELFSGSKIFARDEWPKERRWPILDELVRIPEKFDLPVLCGFAPKSKLKRDLKIESLKQSKTFDVTTHAVAFTICAIAANEYMERKAEADEVASITVENNDQARAIIKTQHNFIRNAAQVAQLPADVRKHLSLSRIVDAVAFAEKMDASPLQVADACAFAIMRRLRHGKDSERFYAPLEPFITKRPNLAKLDAIANPHDVWPY